MGEYAAAKTSVWWDIENCAVPRGCDPHFIVQNISSALATAGYSGPISVSVYGDTSGPIAQHVLHALSSTGVSLNHVPAGIKDASDKKILVDMLFWAIDNPPPANYLLISGDRDFSNALHKLKMRRYNILLAQPPNVSQTLTAAANNVWLWKSLVAGEPPLAQSPYISSATSGDMDDLDTSSSSDTIPRTNPQGQNTSRRDHQIGGNGKTDRQFKVKQPRKNQTDSASKPVSKKENSVDDIADNSKGSTANQQSQPSTPSSTSSSSSEPQDGAKVNQTSKPKIPTFSLPKKPAKFANSHQSSAPHNYFSSKKPGVSTESAPKNGAPDFGNDSGHYNPKHQNQSSQPPKPQNPVTPRPHNGSGNFHTSNSHRSNSCPPQAGHNGVPTAPLQSWPSAPPPYHAPPPNCPDMSRLNISGYPIGGHDNQCLNPNYNPNHSGAVQPPYNNYSYRPPTPSNMSSNMQNAGLWGANTGCSQPYSDYQVLIRDILGALEVLKTEKLPPTEQHISDCIRYGGANLPNFDVKKALELAIQHQAIVTKKLGEMSFFLGKNENLWKCVNIMDTNTRYPKETLDAVQRYISCAAGCSAIKKSQSRYQAATLLKKTCLKRLALGEVLQVTYIITDKMKWFVPHASGWQPLSWNIVVVDATKDAGGKP
ncbi:meiosis regulator and mRNA stability factor 1 [Brachypodium distachyon]|uniref:meiosis regulator and mRNA stability factor 1 n=1 Tax=Brachypodium distachyon TaxID=15368 RepID=UPI0001C75A77|nr:meiosis regulator and mRNA stability factor 1 [Brachypodium distachyon]|eukprot:XP_010234983.1 meiosis regulator and mRNA stability factor 1 [Brachypodium distachyon]